MYTYKYFDLKFENKISIKQRFPLLFSIKIYSSLVYCKLKLEMSYVLKSIVISLFSFSIAFTIVLNESFRCKKPCRWDLVCFSIIESPQPKFVLQDLQHPLETLKADREYLLSKYTGQVCIWKRKKYWHIKFSANNNGSCCYQVI